MRREAMRWRWSRRGAGRCARSTRRGHLLHCARDRDRPLPTRGRRIGDPRCLFPGGVLSG